MSTLITDKVENAAVQKEKLDTSAYLPHTPWLQFLLVCCLFALWGMAGNLNDILIAQFKKGFDLTDTQTALVQSIFFLGYFFVALPAAALIKRFSYKAAIIIGLCLYALGCFLFVPAAQIMTYGAFLACLGVIACGLSFLETSANTYSSLLGCGEVIVYAWMDRRRENSEKPYGTRLRAGLAVSARLVGK
ncbi:L-fucose-proton symporter [Klebsiella pneumoniae]|nr:L-fucose-proton symporter [Klebsiella pneumoniae]CAH5324718.1 L-fucose-proton symporter [Klebsiella pneumoniae]